MKFSYNWLNSFFKKDLPEPEKLAKKLMMRFFEIEGIEKIKGDFLIDVDILPNRASDCFSHFGVAKEIGAIHGLKVDSPKTRFEGKDKDIKDFLEVSVKSIDSVPRYTLRIIEDVKVGKTPEFIKERLDICGLQSINNIVDITNYVMLEMGQPLHAFDGEKISGNKIKVRKAKKGEKIKTLDNDNIKLDDSILVISDENTPIGIAGIKGGKNPEIDNDTNLIYLEAANFDAKTIRKASRKLKLRTEASSRFEHGLDPELADKASKRASYLIQKHAGGKVINGFIDKYPKKNKVRKISLSIEKTKKVLGVELSKERIVEILKSLGLQAKDGKKKIKVNIPTERMDIEIEEDLIEEVGRIYGYENIEPEKPKAAVTTPVINKNISIEKKVKNFLKEAGFTESYNYSFVNEKNKTFFGYENLIKMKNPVSSEYTYLRPSLIAGLLKNVKKNEKRFDHINIFESGKVFKKGESEEKMVSGVLTMTDFRKVKGIIETLFENLGIENINYEKSEINETWSSRSAIIKCKDYELGVLGEISKDILKKLKIGSKVFAFELNMGKMLSKSSEKSRYRKISKFPESIKDISVLVPKKVKYEEVLNKIKDIGNDVLIDVDLFDIYQGDRIPADKKNLGLRFSFQSENKTLSKKEISDLLKEIISGLERNPGWEVRKK